MKRIFNNIHYISDLHVDKLRSLVPLFRTIGSTTNSFQNPNQDSIAIIAGDVGSPLHPHWDETIKFFSNTYSKTLFVPGNHDYDSGALFKKLSYKKYDKIIRSKLENYQTIKLLQMDYDVHNDVEIIGCTLWSHVLKDNSIYTDHNRMFIKHKRWLEKMIKRNDKTKIIVTHYVPTPRLIEQRYLALNNNKHHQLFCTDLSHIVDKSVYAWICGHTHSRLNIKINDTQYCVNAYYS